MIEPHTTNGRARIEHGEMSHRQKQKANDRCDVATAGRSKTDEAKANERDAIDDVMLQQPR